MNTQTPPTDERRRAKPRKPPEQKHGEKIAMKLRTDELATLRERAETSGVQLSTYIRHCALEARAPQPPRPAMDAEAVRELSRIGNNLNQIARALNSGETPQQSDAAHQLHLLRHDLKALTQATLGQIGGDR